MELGNVQRWRALRCLLERADTARKELGKVILESAPTVWEQLAWPPAFEGFEVCSQQCFYELEAVCSMG